MAKWEELPIADRAKYMQVAVQNGYRDIRSIREAYNKFEEGGYSDTKSVENGDITYFRYPYTDSNSSKPLFYEPSNL